MEKINGTVGQTPAVEGKHIAPWMNVVTDEWTTWRGKYQLEIVGIPCIYII